MFAKQNLKKYNKVTPCLLFSLIEAEVEREITSKKLKLKIHKRSSMADLSRQKEKTSSNSNVKQLKYPV